MGEGAPKRPGMRERLKQGYDAVERVAEHLEHPILQTRLNSLTVPGTAEVTGVAAIPGNIKVAPVHEGDPETCLLRLDVTSSDGRRFESAVRQESASGVLRQLAPGLVVAVRCHRREPRAGVTWLETSKLLGRELRWRDSIIDWPPSEEWPALGAIEIRWRRDDRARLDEQRRTWAATQATFVRMGPGDPPYHQGRDARLVTLALTTADGTTQAVSLHAAVPELLGARLVEAAPDEPGRDPTKLVWREGVVLDVLVDPAAGPGALGADTVAIDWERTVNRPEHRSLPPVG